MHGEAGREGRGAGRGGGRWRCAGSNQNGDAEINPMREAGRDSWKHGGRMPVGEHTAAGKWPTARSGLERAGDGGGVRILGERVRSSIDG
jgi:hypothetical protein